MTRQRMIECRINGHNLRLKTQSKPMPETRGNWNDESHRQVKTHRDNIWPWRFMRAGECIIVPYKFANYGQMQNSINGYTRHANGVKFRYRSEASGLAVWCVDRKGENS